MPDIISMDVIFKSGGGLLFGGIYYHGAGFNTVLAAQDTYYQILGFDTNGVYNGTTPDHTNDHIIVPTAGIYLATMSMSTRSAASSIYEIHIKKNNGATTFLNIGVHIVTDVANRLDSCSAMGLIDCDANDTIEVWVQRLDGGAVAKTLTIELINLCVVQVGGT